MIILSKSLAYNWDRGYNWNWDPTTQRYFLLAISKLDAITYLKLLARLLLGLFSIQYYRNKHYLSLSLSLSLSFLFFSAYCLPVFLAGIPTRVKKMVAELAMERRRFSEETELLKSEISYFLCHYKDVIIPALQLDEGSLKAKLEVGEALNIPDDSGNTPAVPDILVPGASAVDLTFRIR